MLASGSALPHGLGIIREDNHPKCVASQRTRMYWQNFDNAPLSSAPGAPNPCLDECISTSLAAAPTCAWPTSDGRNYTFSTYFSVACYCSQRLLSKVGTQGIITGAAALLESDGALCYDIGQNFLTYHAFTIISSLIVVGM